MHSETAYRHVETSQTLLLNEQSRNLESSGKEVFKFGFGQSPFPPLKSAIDELKAQAHQKAYSPVQGVPELREKVAVFHKKIDGIDITPDRVLIAPGSKILIYAVMAVFKKADILIPAPAWVSYEPQALLLGHTPIRVACDYKGRWRVTPEGISKAVVKKKNKSVPTVLILNYPGNPEGLSYNENDLQALSAVFKKHNILVVSDEIYGMLNHTGEHQSLACCYPQGTIVTSGLSKWCGAGGWRLGVALLPRRLNGEFKNVMLGVASETYSCASLPVQMAACKAYVWNDEVKTYIERQRKLLSFVGNWSARTLQAAGIAVHEPEGGFYLFVDFSPLKSALNKKGITSSRKLCEKLLKDTGAALLPGDAFGMKPDHLAARLAYVEFNGAEALAAVAKLGGKPIPASFLNGTFAKTARGIKAIAGWTKNCGAAAGASCAEDDQSDLGAIAR